MQCYLCHTLMVFQFQKAGFEIWRCPGCDLRQTRFDSHYQTFVRKFYDKGYFTGDETRSAYTQYGSDKPFIIRNLQKQLDTIRIFKHNSRLLDVGCAMGYMVELAKNKEYDAYGFDPSEYALSQAAPSVRSKLKHGTIDTVTYSRKYFDVITMFDVLEHLQDPLRNLKRLAKFLKDDGIITIATGDTHSLAAKIMGKRWTFYIPPQHLFFFSKENLTELLSRAGFEPISWFRIDKWLSLQYVLHLAHTDSHFTLAKTAGQLVASLGWGSLPVFLPIRDNITVIARRKNC
jgi:2-polyprenyl-3-methyl-5-hydroxy-6-metoxy-1,4-benzoquinol methylase